MKKIIKNNETYNIDCKDNMCGNCEYKPTSDEIICKLFRTTPDRAVYGFDKDSGWQRLLECKNVEVNE